MGMQHITMSNYNYIISKYYCHAFSLLPPAMCINPLDSTHSRRNPSENSQLEILQLIKHWNDDDCNIDESNICNWAVELISKNDCFTTPITLLSLEIIHERGSYYTCSISQEIWNEYTRAIFLVFSLVFIDKNPSGVPGFKPLSPAPIQFITVIIECRHEMAQWEITTCRK